MTAIYKILQILFFLLASSPSGLSFALDDGFTEEFTALRGRGLDGDDPIPDKIYPLSCAAILCPTFTYCDPFNPGCVPIDCQAMNACPEGSTCVPQKIECIREPCPQFQCVPDKECKKCPKIAIFCPKDCKKCKIHPETCDTCSYAECLDDQCVLCPHVVPECDEDCNKCIVKPQTCKSCAKAICRDRKHEGKKF